MSKFTDKTIQAQKPREKQYKVSVGDGLYLVVNPTGTKWWRFDYRFGGKQKTISLGVYGKAPDGISLEAATDAAIDMRRLVKAGIDPSDKRKAEKAADSTAASVEPQPKITFGKVADDWLKTREGGGEKTYARDARMVATRTHKACASRAAARSQFRPTHACPRGASGRDPQRARSA